VSSTLLSLSHQSKSANERLLLQISILKMMLMFGAHQTWKLLVCGLFCLIYIIHTSIAEAARLTWRSDVYNHYNITLRRDFHPGTNKPMALMFVFTCKTHPDTHTVQFRPRMKTGEGTNNLRVSQNLCHSRHGEGGSIRQMAASTIPYSASAHRALIAMRCAKNHRPFSMVTDDEYLAEVDMLRPGTNPPAPATVSRDIGVLYLEMSKHVLNYFQVGFKYCLRAAQDATVLSGPQRHNSPCP